MGSPIIRLALAHWPAAAVLIDRDGRISAGNLAAARLFGYQQSALTAVAVDELIPAWRPLDRDHNDPGARRSRRRRATGHRLDGSTFALRFVQLPVVAEDTHCTLIAIAPRAGLVGATVDAAARRQAEETLHHAQKTEALGTLAGGIAHDFNNILSAITGNTRLAMQELPSDHPVQSGLAEVAKASARATDLVNRILTFSRQSECRREVMSLQPAVEEALALLRATLPAMIEINCSFSERLPPVRADATQIHQVIINLVTNAAHAIGDGAAGCITVSLDKVHITHGRAHGSVLGSKLKAGRYLRLSVSDTGSGMDSATLDRVFDPFFTTKPVGRGTGLGLSVVEGIMRSHDGSVLVTSEPGRGTTFRLYFPAVDASLPAGTQRAPVDSSGAQAHGRGRRVMYIDDEEALVYLMTRVLQKSGYRVTGFSDAEQALEALRDRPGEFDVIVTDLSMPGMSGFHVARAVQTIRDDLPVVITSGYVRSEDRQTAREIGVRDLVLKPDTVEELARVLEQLIEH
ncbi:MAG: ATP-binding protein [Pseudomonadota bacterium]|nr:ATP-binding protein [Pseudomonadota bacterium]